jgi:hypothetical protein
VAIERTNRGLCLVWCCHLDETEAAGSAALKVGDHLRLLDFSLLGKEGPQIGRGGMEVEVSYMEIAEHALIPSGA